MISSAWLGGVCIIMHLFAECVVRKSQSPIAYTHMAMCGREGPAESRGSITILR
jgi:hypothetical protein